MTENVSRSNSLADLAARIRAAHAAVETALKRGLQEAMAAGDLLIEAKVQMQHGKWASWLREYCALPERTARLYMRLARHREKIEIGNVADLSVRGALALIAVPTVTNDELVLGWLHEIVDTASGELGLAAYEVSRHTHKLRTAAYREARAAIDRIIALAEASPAAHSVALDAESQRLIDQFIKEIGTAQTTLNAPEAFSPCLAATEAALKAKNITAKMLRRVEAASR